MSARAGASRLALTEQPRWRSSKVGVSYTLLIFDNRLPGVSGLELARRARLLVHRRSTPVVIISASEVRAEALHAGADVFLRKPEDIALLVGTVKSLVGR